MDIQFPFELTQLIGAGGSARVWRALHGPSGRQVALKVFELEGHAGTDVEEFFRETRFVARAAHLNILEVWGYGRSGVDVRFDDELAISSGQLYLVSEYVEAGSLESLVGKLEWSRVQEILLGLLAGLGRVHARGIVHLDLKPANVLMSERGPLISDFGVAAPIFSGEGHQHEQGLYGTPTYMAPEQSVSRAHVYGPWTDLYALGCLAHTLITGRPPYQADNLVELLVAHRDAPIPKLEAQYDVPTGFDSWLTGLLNKSWNRRFQRAIEARMQLAALGSQTVLRRGASSAHFGGLAMVGMKPSIPLETVRDTYSADDDTLRVAIGDALHTVQLSDTDGQPYAEVTMPPYETVQGTLSMAKAPKGIDRGLVGIENARLFGREREKKRLWDTFLNYVKDPKSCSVEIIGSTGMGKSALADWFGTAAHEFVGAQVFWLTHSPTMGPGDGIYNAFARYFRLGTVSSEFYATRIAQRLCLDAEDALVSDLASMFESRLVDESTVEHSFIVSMYERFSTLAQLLIYLSVRRPTILIVDDAQWAFQTHQFLESYLKHRSAVPVFVVQTIQSDAVRPMQRSTDILSASKKRFVRSETVALTPLAAEVVYDWVKAAVGDTTLSQQAIIDAVAGNPLSAKALIYTSGIDRGTEESFGHPSLEMLLARQFQVWKARTDLVSIQALRVVAFLGKNCTVEEWLGVFHRLEYEGNASTLTPAIDAQLIERNNQGQIVFVHQGIMHAVVKELTVDEGRRMHREIAIFLEDEPAPDYGRVAYHYSQCGDHLKASELWFKTAILSRDRTDYPSFRWGLVQSANQLRHAKVSRSDRRWIELSVYWILCRRVMRESGAVMRRADRTIRLANVIHDDYLTALAYREKSRLIRVLDGYAGAVADMETAVRYADRTTVEELQIRARLNLADLKVHLGELTETRSLLRWVEQRLDIVGKSIPRNLMVEFLNLSAYLASRLEKKDETLDFAMRAHEITRDLPSKRSRAHALNLVGESLRSLGRFREAIPYYLEAIEYHTIIDSIDTPASFLNLAFNSIALEAFDEAAEHVESARRWLSKQDTWTSLCDFTSVVIENLKGHFEEPVKELETFEFLSTSTWGEVDLVHLSEKALGASIRSEAWRHAVLHFRVFENQARRCGDHKAIERLAEWRARINQGGLC